LKGIRLDLAECMPDVEFETHVISIGENEWKPNENIWHFFRFAILYCSGTSFRGQSFLFSGSYFSFSDRLWKILL